MQQTNSVTTTSPTNSTIVPMKTKRVHQVGDIINLKSKVKNTKQKVQLKEQQVLKQFQTECHDLLNLVVMLGVRSDVSIKYNVNTESTFLVKKHNILSLRGGWTVDFENKQFALKTGDRVSSIEIGCDEHKTTGYECYFSSTNVLCIHNRKKNTNVAIDLICKTINIVHGKYSNSGVIDLSNNGFMTVKMNHAAK